MNNKPKFNPQIHHRKSIRLKGYDYAQAGLYFITICCQNRIHRFGEVVDGKMVCNAFGRIAYDEWLKTPEIRPNVELDEFIIMPNHMHGIIRLLDSELHSPNNTTNELHVNDNTDEFNSHQQPNEDVCKTNHKGEFNSPITRSPPQSPSQTVGAIVRGYKSAVTKQLRLLGFDDKLWQRNYYEHIIRDERSYQNIAEYIINNPAKWARDKFHDQ